MSSSAKMAAVPSSFGVVTVTMTVRIIQMKQTAVSLTDLTLHSVTQETICNFLGLGLGLGLVL